ncbi:hypothetical protein [Actinokineospora globicatena]|uniref:hypothetical protein n=1 Tax=Actinokineospora globicatena TaxID=103729 RepID=UPI0020A2A29D|nr:hypothetical protein [Actinokineospora globicatena]MCP2302080.1 hypothetical protein [Actinokineospora globicatena]GLW76258.1 hypothetical protein Aglo01_07400 [Actinokineospora globicatena]GLW83094.1 hypothetical protein Aglo02_07340 [Actinokineospora globicatena]
MTTTAPPGVTARALVPGGLLVLLFLAVGVLALLAPRTGDDADISEIHIALGSVHDMTVPHEVLECARQDRTATCTVDILGEPLRVAMTHGGTDGDRYASCSATYAGRSTSCAPSYAMDPDYTVGAYLPGLDLTPEEFELAADQVVPWWRFQEGGHILLPVVVFVLPLVAALVVGFTGRTRAAEAPLLMMATAVGWFALLVFATAVHTDRMIDLLIPAAVIGGITVVAWQWALTRPGWRTGFARGLETLVLSGLTCVTAMVFVLLGGATI